MKISERQTQRERRRRRNTITTWAVRVGALLLGVLLLAPTMAQLLDNGPPKDPRDFVIPVEGLH